MDNKTKEIIDYYGKRVSKHGDCGHATLLDDNMRVLEIETVQNWLRKEDQVLEIFCGNGAWKRNNRKIKIRDCFFSVRLS